MKMIAKTVFQRAKTPVMALICMPLLAIPSQVGMAQVPAKAAPYHVQDEYAIYGNVNTAGGEDEVAVNPTDPNNIIVAVLAGINRMADGEVPDGTAEQRTRRGQEANAFSVFAVTWNRGQTWTYSEDHTGRSNFDPAVAFGPDGTLYRYVEASGDFKTSVDKGKTWSPAGAGLSLRGRAEIFVDNSTGTVYVDAPGSTGTPAHASVSVVASNDKGTTWTAPQWFDSPEYPALAVNISSAMTAGNGRMAVAYISGTAGGAAPRIVFGTSKDYGKTFERHVVPYQGAADFVMLAGDQSTPGKYAIMTMSPDRTQLPVYVTKDYGNTWSRKVVAARAPAGTIVYHKGDKAKGHNISDDPMLDIKYSNKGQLAILWRAIYPDGSFDIWSSFSPDGGKTFKSLRVNNATSPPKSLDRSNFLNHDDYWDLDFDNEFVHFVYTASQPGYLASWYARIPISDYLSPPARVDTRTQWWNPAGQYIPK